MMSTANVKSTINLNKYCKEQLEYLVKIKKLNSVTEGINTAIENFVKEQQRLIYAEQMKQAISDKDFIERTMNAQKDFEPFDSDTFMRTEGVEW